MNSHPSYDEENYKLWRLIKEGGKDFVEEYLVKREQETETEFSNRKDQTPDPAIAASAIDDVRSAFAPRMEVTRTGGHEIYQAMMKGLEGGVDGNHTTQDDYLKTQVLPELLFMGKVGVLIVNTDPPTIPYCELYKAEDIWNWSYSRGQLTKLVLNESAIIYKNGLPSGETKDIHRIFTLTPNGVEMTITDRNDAPLDEDLNSGEFTQILRLTEIPFVIYELPHSLLKSIDRYQITYLNLESSDIAWLFRANMTIYTEQGSAIEDQIRRKKTDDETQDMPKVLLGDSIGRRYGVGMDRPQFIAPPTEPIETSMKKQKQIEDRIKDILKTKLSELKMASAESLTLRERGLESGLAAIGSVLRSGDVKTAIVIHMYLGSDERPSISYPVKYELRTEEDRVVAAKALKEIQISIGSLAAKKQLEILICRTLLEAKIPAAKLREIESEIEQSELGIYDPTQVVELVNAGIISHEIAGIILNTPKDDYKKAEEEHRARLIAIQQAQSTSGVPDTSPDPQFEEKEKKKT